MSVNAFYSWENISEALRNSQNTLSMKMLFYRHAFGSEILSSLLHMKS